MKLTKPEFIPLMSPSQVPQLSTISLTASPPFCHIPPFSALPGCGGITRQRHGNLSRPVTCCLIQIGCGNSPFHSSSLPVARAPTNLRVTMTIRAAGWPSVCAFSGSFPPFFSSVKQSVAVSHPPPLLVFILSTCAPHLHLIYCVHLNYTQFAPTLITGNPTPPPVEARSVSLRLFVSPWCSPPSICLSTPINTFTIPSLKLRR